MLKYLFYFYSYPRGLYLGVFFFFLILVSYSEKLGLIGEEKWKWFETQNSFFL